MLERHSEAGLRIVQLDTWEEYTTFVIGEDDPHFIYRGQRDPEWKLESPWERHIRLTTEVLPKDRPIQSCFDSNGYETIRGVYLKLFKQKVTAINDQQMLPNSDDEWWARGRHWGLRTPILDWTEDPRIAAFFALIDWYTWFLEASFDPQAECEENRRRAWPAVSIWRLERLNSIEFKKVGDFASARQRAQRGVFTYLADGLHFDLESYLSACGELKRLCRFDLATMEGKEALIELHKTDWHYASLFPDDWGAARYANVMPHLDTEMISRLLRQPPHSG